MIALDMKTVLFANVIIDVVGLVVMFILWFQNRNKYSGLFYWVLDWVLMTAGIILIILQYSMPPWTSVILSNSLMAGGTLVLYFGLRRFAGMKNNPMLVFLLLFACAIFIAADSYFTYIHNDLTSRNYLVSTGLLLISSLCSWLMFKSVSPQIRRFSRGVAIAFAVIGLICITRLIGFVLIPQTSDQFLQSGRFDTLFVMLTVGANAFLFFNLVLMVNRRLYIETEEMEETSNINAMRLQVIFKTTSIGLGIMVNRIFREVNDSFCEMIGYSREEIIGIESRKFFPTEEEYLAVGQMYLKIMQLDFVTAETRLLRKDNKIINVILSSSALDKNDLSKGIVFSMVDFTERKLLEEKSNYLATFPELNPNPILELDQDCNLLYQNPISERIFPVLGNKGLDHPFLVDWPQVVKTLQDAKWLGSIIREIKIGNAYFEQVIYPVAKNQIRIYARNITARKRAEEDLKVSEQNFHNSLESLLTGIRIRDSEDCILFINQAYLDIFGYKNIEEAKLTSPIDHYTPDSYADYLLRKKQIEKGVSGPTTIEVDIIRKDGAIRHLQVTGKRVLWGDKMQLQTFYNDITEQKRVEAALKLSEQNFRNSMDSSFLGIYIANDTWKPMYLNKALLDIFGYENFEEVKASPPHEHYTPESHADYLQRSNRLSRGESNPDNFEIDIIRKDGAIRHLQVFRRELFWDGQQQYQVLYNDVTERKQAEEALKASEVSYRRLFESAKDGILIIDAMTGLIYDANPFLNDLLGLSLEEIKGRELWEIGTFTDIVSSKSRFQELLQKGYMRYEDLPLKTKDGRNISVEFVSNVYDVDHRRVIQCNIRNITERKQAEAALKASEARYKTLFESAAEGIIIADIETQQQKYVNPAICKMLGYTQEELTKMSIGDIHPRDSRDSITAEFSARTKGEKTTVTLPCLRKDSSVIYMDISATRANIDGRECVIAFFTDITERKQAEEKIMASLSEKETLLKEVHHRVKNNMQVISSLLRLQEGKVKDKNAAALLRDSQNRIQSMALVYNKLYQSDNLASIKMTDYINELIAGLIKSYAAGPSRVSVNVVPSEVLLSIDMAVPCGLVINELVTNSLKYAFPENRKGQISVSLKEDNGHELELVVSDDGVGMPDNINLVDTGTLGIRLVTNLVQGQLGGKIELDCNHGTKYQISFPRAKEEIK